MTVKTPEPATDTATRAPASPSALSSMTGFARVEGSHEGHVWAFEAKSVNGRGLDLRVRMPSGFEALETDIRKRMTATFKRGNIQLNLQIARAEGATSLRVNEKALEQVIGVLTQLNGRLDDVQPASLDGILNVKGVLELDEPEETEAARAARTAAVLDSAVRVIAALDAARREEGASISTVLAGQVDRIATLVEEAEHCAAARPEALRERLRRQMSDLVDKDGLSEDRLYQEAAILITKADIREELDRLKAHVAAARDLLTSREAIGRRFDFLTQEFNREANTLCSKSSDIALTRIGLELKVVIDQMREQVQNVE